VDKRPILDAVQMQAMVQAVLRALKMGQREKSVQSLTQVIEASGSARIQENILARQNTDLAAVSTDSNKSVINNWNQIKFTSKLILPFYGKEKENVLN